MERITKKYSECNSYIDEGLSSTPFGEICFSSQFERTKGIYYQWKINEVMSKLYFDGFKTFTSDGTHWSLEDNIDIALACAAGSSLGTIPFTIYLLLPTYFQYDQLQLKSNLFHFKPDANSKNCLWSFRIGESSDSPERLHIDIDKLAIIKRIQLIQQLSSTMDMQEFSSMLVEEENLTSPDEIPHQAIFELTTVFEKIEFDVRTADLKWPDVKL